MRRCSNCKKIGHTKKSCKKPELKLTRVIHEDPLVEPDLDFDVSPEATPISQTTPKKKESEKAIFVHVTKDAEHSPHMLELKNKKESKPWERIPVFQEKNSTTAKRASVDLAEMVRSANAKHKEYTNKKSAHAYFSQLPKMQKPVFGGNKKLKIKKQKQKNKFSKKQDIPEDYAHVPIKYSNSIADSLSLFIERVTNRSSTAFTNKRFWIAVTTFIILIGLPFPAFAYYKQLKHTSASVLEQSSNGFLALQSSAVAAFHSNLPDAQHNLDTALESFSRAQSLVDGEHQVLQYIASLLPFVGTEIDSRRHILNAGHHVALANTYVLKGIEETEQDKNPNLTDRFYNLREHFRFALPQYKEALNDLASVDADVIPSEYQESFQDFKVLFTAFVDDTQNMIDFIDTMQKVFGSDDFKRYLIVFQNNRELRPTGGFMGSFAVLDVQKGKILGLDVPAGGTYDLQGQLSVHVKPPVPLLLTNNRWEFQDANWWPDFPASAQKMAWFYQHGRGNTVDGVIAINATVFEKLLSVIGPIQNEKHAVTLSAATALDDLQYKVEVDYDTVSNTPKAIIGDLAAQLLTDLPKQNTAAALKLLLTLHDSLQNKEIQAYFTDKSTEQTIQQFGWGGEIVKTEPQQDYLMAVNTNIQGQKSDAKIKQEIEHQAEVQEDGTVIDTVVIRRTHSGVAGEIFTGKPNISYLRVYVPAGAELLDAGGFSTIGDALFRPPEEWAKDDTDLAEKEINRKFDSKTGTETYNSFGKAVFANWVVTNPGETSEVFFSYRIPKLVNMHAAPELTPHKWETAFFGAKSAQASRYSLVSQKQSGIDSTLSSTVIYPKTWRPAWKSRDDIDLALNGGIFKTILNKDEVYGIVMEK
ncbi:MAG: hypothetical protein A3B90_01025 [Candidatus Magasanikbacteria bacterium RIFCSPHIGHO2_02_FULL_41_13]|uniref:Uncharacterized protein n=1 Tax=Candidatus Magasanikbacteria bacterium RIFCSPHIGHO2_02_FULL_41_13 TaxID=1798676 RepID=A0A1F6M4V3_9BACT|nr:MAG: hypothetical protein A3B90_01025 [Candidatus Magasanikbacteria bacterium RIFCSPHIGHO2_02_FULL_41_13]